MVTDQVPSAGYEEVYEALNVDSMGFGLDEELSQERDYIGEMVHYSEEVDYRTAYDLCIECAEVYSVTGLYPILMVEDPGLMTVALGREGQAAQVHPDFYLDSTWSNLDAIDLVFEEATDYQDDLLELFSETVKEVPDLSLRHRAPFSGQGILQGAWIAPGIEHLYDFSDIQNANREFLEEE